MFTFLFGQRGKITYLINYNFKNTKMPMLCKTQQRFHLSLSVKIWREFEEFVCCLIYRKNLINLKRYIEDQDEGRH